MGRWRVIRGGGSVVVLLVVDGGIAMREYIRDCAVQSVCRGGGMGRGGWESFWSGGRKHLPTLY